MADEPNSTENPETTPATTPADPPAKPDDKPGEKDDDLPVWAREKLTKANAEAANYRTRLREAETKLGGAKTVEEFEAATAELKEANQKLERQIIVGDAARKYDLPAELAARLVGTTKEELEADAEKLSKLVGTTGSIVDPRDVKGGLNPLDDDAPFDPVAAARTARRLRY